MWIYVDPDNRILAARQSSMAGNYGWHEAECDIPEEPCNGSGVPLYKFVDGIVLDRTQEEIDGDYTPPPAQQTDAQRIAQLEEELVAAKILLGLEE